MAIRFCKVKRNEVNMDLGIKLDSDFFIKAKNVILNKHIEYLPIIDEDGNLLFGCYDDEDGDKILRHILAMSTSTFALNELRKFKEVTIVSCNEIGFNLYFLFKKAGCKVNLVGEIWDKVIESANVIDTIHGHGIYCEGNTGLNIDMLGTWRNAFPFDEYGFLESLYQDYNKNHNLYNNTWLNKKKCNMYLKDKILSKEPFMAARLGNTESIITQEFLYGSYSQKWLNWLYSTSGFFSTNEQDLSDVDRYAQMTLDAVSNCDINCCRFDNEIGIINIQGLKESVNVDWYDLYTDFNPQNTWLSALENKKVLIISSISNSIRKQYKNKDKLFTHCNLLPDIEIIYYPTLQTQLGRNCGFKSWFNAYEKMLYEIKSIDFDIALIAAGAYGYPLASDIKDMGKQAIELCTGIYPIFGIKVKTQAIIRKVSMMYNKHWIFPLEEAPKEYMYIEKGAYWG